VSILRFFEYDHLRDEVLREVSRRFHALAHSLAEELTGSAELTVSLRKLLEAKDAAVRAALPPV
jgi:hypothetical protein